MRLLCIVGSMGLRCVEQEVGVGERRIPVRIVEYTFSSWISGLVGLSEFS